VETSILNVRNYVIESYIVTELNDIGLPECALSQSAKMMNGDITSAAH